LPPHTCAVYLLQVTASLASIQSALQAIRSGDYAAASAAARAARAAAESAFLHPAVLAQLNFPESHKLGVYMPLFLPLCVPVLKGLLLEVKRYMKSRRAWLSSSGRRQ
jgi:phosphatidylinositol glycan class S